MQSKLENVDVPFSVPGVPEQPKKKLRSICDAFDWLVHCFVTSLLQVVILATVGERYRAPCKRRDDDWAGEVRVRLNVCRDFSSYDALYDVECQINLQAIRSRVLAPPVEADASSDLSTA